MTDPTFDDAVTIPRYIDEETRVVDVDHLRLSDVFVASRLATIASYARPLSVHEEDERRALIELQQRRASDLEHNDVLSIRRACNVCAALRDTTNNVDRPEFARIVDALEKILTAHGAKP